MTTKRLKTNMKLNFFTMFSVLEIYSYFNFLTVSPHGNRFYLSEFYFSLTFFIHSKIIFTLKFRHDTQWGLMSKLFHSPTVYQKVVISASSGGWSPYSQWGLSHTRECETFVTRVPRDLTLNNVSCSFTHRTWQLLHSEFRFMQFVVKSAKILRSTHTQSPTISNRRLINTYLSIFSIVSFAITLF